MDVSNTEDLFAKWKEQRFIIADPKWLSEEYKRPFVIVLTDIGFWADNADALVDWCEANDCKTAGMTVEIADEKTLSMFILRWT